MSAHSLLPGLVVIAGAFASRELLARWYPVPSRRVLACFLVLVSVLLAPSLFGGRVQLPLHLLKTAPPFESLELSHEPANALQLDLILQEGPHEITTRRQLGAGEWPLWNPLMGAGMPMLADPQAHAHWLQPLAIPTLFLPVEQSFAVLTALRILAALVFTFLFLRRLGCGAGPAFFGAVAYGFGGFLVLWLGWPLANSATLLPLLLFSVVLTAGRGARRDWLLLSVAVFATVLAGHPETILHALVTAGCVALAILARASRNRRPRLLAGWLCAATIGAACAAPALLPTFEYLPKTHRAELVERRNVRLASQDPLADWRTAESRERAALEAAKRLAPAIAPNALGNDFHGSFRGEGNIYLSTTGFAGTLTLALALAGLFSRGERFPLERGIAWVGLPLAFLVLARPPGLMHLLASIPVLDRSANHHARVTLLIGFFLAVLAACALERWSRGQVTLGALAAGTLTAIGLVLALHAGFAPDDPEGPVGLRRTSSLVQAGVPLVGLGILVGAGGRTAWARVAPAALGLVVFLESGYFTAPANPAVARSLFYPETSSVRFLGEHVGRGRVLGLGDVLRPNVPSVYGLPDPRISNPAKPWKYVAFIASVTRSPRDILDVVNEPTHPLYRFLGVRYVLVRDRFPLEPVLRRVFEEDGLLIYEHPDPLPLLFLPRAAVRQGERPLRWVREQPDFHQTALAAGIPGGEATWRSHQASSGTITLSRRSAPHVAARARLDEGRLLASSIYQDGNWHLLVDGRRVSTVLTNTAFVGAWLEPGEHALELLYRPRSFVLGCGLAGLALALGLAWWVPSPSTRRFSITTRTHPWPIASSA